jgi:hypothetical protein
MGPRWRFQPDSNRHYDERRTHIVDSQVRSNTDYKGESLTFASCCLYQLGYRGKRAPGRIRTFTVAGCVALSLSLVLSLSLCPNSPNMCPGKLYYANR